ncbi:hypothetical protein E2C01_080658 [Portunus trituberculatus]|uniref:Uncharacterized protein n=1 Tax=Portunus trituberculatus TaxID=210409 RepID=A0A5B7IMS2_PORTR|nr:hypothetical protein [Portunus trituberculatus]
MSILSSSSVSPCQSHPFPPTERLPTVSLHSSLSCLSVSLFTVYGLSRQRHANPITLSPSPPLTLILSWRLPISHSSLVIPFPSYLKETNPINNTSLSFLSFLCLE